MGKLLTIKIPSALKDRIKRWQFPNEPYSSVIERFMLKGKKCEDCGSKDKLCLHHVDRNTDNNLYGNAQVLCVHCHPKKHPWKWTKEQEKQARLIREANKELFFRQGLRDKGSDMEEAIKWVDESFGKVKKK